VVDVRESYEYAAASAGMPPVLLGGNIVSVPLGQLAGRIAGWLAAPVPLVFVCRSGKRSTRAALCLRRLGHAQAYDLAGGIALAALPALPLAA
jgi:cysteine desulfurase